MSIEVTYFAQAAHLIGTEQESFEAVDLRSLLKAVHARNGTGVESMICSSEGDPVPWLLIDVNGRLVRDPDLVLSPDSQVRLISPISGG